MKEDLGALIQSFQASQGERDTKSITPHAYGGSTALRIDSAEQNNRFVLCYIHGGDWRIAWDDGETPELCAGSLALLRPRPVLEFFPAREGGWILYLFIRKTLIYQTLLPLISSSVSVFDYFIRCMDKKGPDRCLVLPGPADAVLLSALSALLSAARGETPDGEKLMESYLAILLILFSRVYHTANWAHRSRPSFDELLRYLSEHCASASLESAASDFGYNPCYLSRLIRGRTGRTFSDILRDFKLERACLLIRETDLPISQIACLAGYNHMGNFYKQFKSKYNFTPKALRDLG